MRRLRRAAIVVVPGVLVAVLVLSGLAAGGGKGKGGKRIVLVGGPPTQEEIDVGEAGPSAGDMLVGRADMLNRKGKKVGFVRFTCVFNVGTGAMCTNHLRLAGRGQIVSQRSANLAGGPVVVEAITGGTGEFRNARGQVRVDFSQGPPTITIRLL